jgi:NhaP-type Na+/H+ or K+/H+ antiporter
MTQAVLVFNEQLERIGEVVVVVLVGGMLTLQYLPPEALWFMPLMFFVIRPVAVQIGLLGSGTPVIRRNYMSWFGIRGIGSIYYLMYAVHHGVPENIASSLVALTLSVVAASIVLHGISVTGLMNIYGRIMRRGG